MYIERRMTPPQPLRAHGDARTGRKAVLDYGQAIRDLAVTNIFPGDCC